MITHVLAISLTLTLAHSWYDYDCCSNTDCKELSPDAVIVRPDGYLLPNGMLVPFGRERPSRDFNYHWCTHSNGQLVGGYEKQKMCFYAPPGSG